MARISSLPGCHTQAKTIPVLYQRIQEAAELCLELEKNKRKILLKEKFVGVQQIQVSL